MLTYTGKSVEVKGSMSETREQDANEQESLFGRAFETLFLPEVIKKAVISGIRSVLASEEFIKTIASTVIPKDAFNYIRQQVDNSRSEILRIISKEIQDFLQRTNLGAELQKILTSLTFEITTQTQVRFVPSDSKLVTPEVTGKVSTTKVRRKKRN